ncbi:MAG: 50S ribosomal protein L24 [Egibacteraceae bacterium]
MNRVKKNDTVRVIAGKDRGTSERPKEGRVIRVYPKQDRVLVEGVNRATKHTQLRTGGRGAQEGGISHEEAPIPLSNVMPVCPSCGAPTRVGTRVVDGARTRYCRKCESEF